MTTGTCPHGHGCYLCQRAEQRRLEEEADKDCAGPLTALVGFTLLLMTLTVYVVFGWGHGTPGWSGCGVLFDAEVCGGTLRHIYILVSCAGVSVVMMAVGLVMALFRRAEKRRIAGAGA